MIAMLADHGHGAKCVVLLRCPRYGGVSVHVATISNYSVFLIVPAIQHSSVHGCRCKMRAGFRTEHCTLCLPDTFRFFVTNPARPMNLRLIFYKALNKLCRADVTRVLWLAVPSMRAITAKVDCDCQWISVSDLKEFQSDPEFQISDAFIQDFTQDGFVGVVAYVDKRPVGLLFLVPDQVAARHNSAGAAFTGISVKLPEGVCFLFKVIVKSSQRGQRIQAAMLQFAVHNYEQHALRAIVTTTDWTNNAFLQSVESLGFERVAMASEFIVAGRRFYQLPRPLDVHSGQSAANGTEKNCACFLAQHHE